MAEKTDSINNKLSFRHRGRGPQVYIYFGKFIRMFIYQNDWKVLPMAAVIAGMVSLVIRNDFCVTMEGTLKGALALSCVALWNGCFNSIQSICRERGIIKREHRAGMHVSSYVTAHVLYQAILCVLQSALTVYICVYMGVHFSAESAEAAQNITSPFGALKEILSNPNVLRIGVTIFLITFAADMISLLISGVVHSTTAAMTVMPFLLVFQLVFSGGIFSVPKSLEPLTNLTISKYGIRCIAAQAGYNDLDMVTGWNTLYKMKDTEIEESVKVDQAVSMIRDGDNETAAGIRESKLTERLTVGEALTILTASPDYEEHRNDEIPLKVKIGDLFDFFGEDNVKEKVVRATAEASQREEFENTENNIHRVQLMLLEFSAVYILLTMIALKFIDKDKR